MKSQLAAPIPLLLATSQSWRLQRTAAGRLGRERKAAGTRASPGPCSLPSSRTSRPTRTGPPAPPAAVGKAFLGCLCLPHSLADVFRIEEFPTSLALEAAQVPVLVQSHQGLAVLDF